MTNHNLAVFQKPMVHSPETCKNFSYKLTCLHVNIPHVTSHTYALIGVSRIKYNMWMQSESTENQ